MGQEKTHSEQGGFMLLALIGLLEILFWVCLFSGLFVRYVFGWQRISVALLILTPFTDLVQLIVALFDVAGGGYPSFLHGMAAFYIGFSIAGGQQVIHMMDARFSARFNGVRAQKTSKRVRSPKQQLQLAYKDWRRCVYASVVSLLILVTLIAVAGYRKSFWLIYWVIVVLFTVVMWWILGVWRLKRKLGIDK